MKKFSIALLLIPILIGTMACNKQQSDRSQETVEEEQRAEDRDTLAEEIDLHPEDSMVMAEEKEQEKAARDSLPIVVIKKGSCYGKCPVYEARLYKDGRAEYDGDSNVEHIGSYTAQMDSNKIKRIYEIVSFIDYFSLSNRYPEDSEPIADLPNTITTVRKNSKEHTVVNNSGAPRELTDFEEFLERTFNDLNWKSVSSEEAND